MRSVACYIVNFLDGTTSQHRISLSPNVSVIPMGWTIIFPPNLPSHAHHNRIDKFTHERWCTWLPISVHTRISVDNTTVSKLFSTLIWWDDTSDLFITMATVNGKSKWGKTKFIKFVDLYTYSWWNGYLCHISFQCSQVSRYTPQVQYSGHLWYLWWKCTIWMTLHIWSVSTSSSP